MKSLLIFKSPWLALSLGSEPIQRLWDEGWEVEVWKNLFGVKILIYRPRSG